MTDEQIGHVRDDDLGDVLTLGRMYKTDDAVHFLYDKLGIPDITVSALTRARHRGQIKASVFGQSVVYAERDLLAWVASRYGNSEEFRAEQSRSVRAAKAAARAKRGE